MTTTSTSVPAVTDPALAPHRKRAPRVDRRVTACGPGPTGGRPRRTETAGLISRPGPRINAPTALGARIAHAAPHHLGQSLPAATGLARSPAVCFARRHPVGAELLRTHRTGGRVRTGHGTGPEARRTPAAREEQRVQQGSTPDPHLDDLLIRAAGGDQEAFAGVYDALAGTVMGVACRTLRDAAQAEEVVQDVMIEVWRTADRYRRERGTAKTWVVTLAHRRAVDRVRTAQARADREQRAGMLSPGRPFDEVAETVEHRDEHRRVHRCLNSLEDPQRVPLVLAYYQGLTYREVAHVLSTTPGTVKSRMREGLRQLRACLEAGS